MPRRQNNFESWTVFVPPLMRRFRPYDKNNRTNGTRFCRGTVQIGGCVTAATNASGSAVDATSEMVLSNGANGATELKWNAEIVVVGKIASVASRMLGSITRKLTTSFFDCVKRQIEA